MCRLVCAWPDPTPTPLSSVRHAPTCVRTLKIPYLYVVKEWAAQPVVVWSHKNNTNTMLVINEGWVPDSVAAGFTRGKPPEFIIGKIPFGTTNYKKGKVPRSPIGHRASLVNRENTPGQGQFAKLCCVMGGVSVTEYRLKSIPPFEADEVFVFFFF